MLIADYIDLYGLKNNSDLNNRIEVAISKSAYDISNENPATDNHANRLAWAKEALSDPGLKSSEMLWALLAKHSDASLGAILGSSDEFVQSAVSGVVDLFAVG